MLITKNDEFTSTRSWRLVVDYTAFNAITISAEYPIPSVLETLDMLHGAKVFTIMDINKGSISYGWTLETNKRRLVASLQANMNFGSCLLDCEARQASSRPS